MMEALAQGATVVMLADQRMNNGITVPFFGIPAMTASALARLAFRFDVPVVPVQTERLAPATFKVTVEEPLDVPRSGNAAIDEAAMMTAVNNRIEAWIRARPEQWLWLHRRWPRDAKPASFD
ncbi:MAG: lysophospholipid acyltransferase family protein [Alphaproteobacteria bacterium]